MTMPAYPLRLKRRVEFAQTDAAGIMHFSTYFILMEAAEAELFRKLGLSLLARDNDRTIGFPRVDCRCRFKRPLHFDEEVTCVLEIDDIIGGRIAYRFAFLNREGKRTATGSLTTACAMRDATGALKGHPLPDAVRDKLESWKNPAA